MSTELDQARLLAERIARRVTSDSSAALNPSSSRSDVSLEIASVRAMLSQLQKRLTQLEARVRFEDTSTRQSNKVDNARQAPTHTAFAPPTHSPWLAGVNATAGHASEERFGIEEATINELVDFFQNEKTCSIDPSGKPCDHCAMCSSRGF